MAEQSAREDVGVSGETIDAIKQKAAADVAAANRRAAEANEAKEKAETQVITEFQRRVAADEMAINNSITAATAAQDAAQRELTEAIAANDAAAIAAAQVKVTRAVNHLDRAEENLRKFTGWKEQQIAKAAEAEERRKNAPPPKPQEGDQLDLSPFTKPTADWIAKHPEMMLITAGGEAKRQIAMAGHWEAIEAGLKPDTDAYFEFMDRAYNARTGATREPEPQTDLGGYDGGSPYSQAAVEIDLNKPADQRIVKQDPAPRPAATRETSSALPPSRTTPSPTGRPPAGRVSLTPREQEIARLSFPDLKTDEERLVAYAQNKAALQAEGRLN